MWKYYLISLLSYLILDRFWFNFSLPSYNKVIQNIQNQPMQFRPISLIAYLLLALGMTLFVLVPEKPVIYGAVYGLIVYGIFNMTNLTLFKDWTLNISVIDTLWGIFVSFLTAFISKLIIKMF